MKGIEGLANLQRRELAPKELPQDVPVRRVDQRRTLIQSTLRHKLWLRSGVYGTYTQGGGGEATNQTSDMSLDWGSIAPHLPQGIYHPNNIKAFQGFVLSLKDHLSMPKIHATPEDFAEALALREAGFTVLSISQRLGISIRTLQRHFALAGARKGAAKAEVLQRAKEELMARITSDQAIKEEAARLVADDLAHSIHLREVILAASRQMRATNLEEAALVMRAAAAYSTTIKNTSDIIRHSLRLKELGDDPHELPELVVTELAQEEVAQLCLQNDYDGMLPPEYDELSEEDQSDIIEELPA